MLGYILMHANGKEVGEAPISRIMINNPQLRLARDYLIVQEGLPQICKFEVKDDVKNFAPKNFWDTYYAKEKFVKAFKMLAKRARLCPLAACYFETFLNMMSHESAVLLSENKDANFGVKTTKVIKATANLARLVYSHKFDSIDGKLLSEASWMGCVDAYLASNDEEIVDGLYEKLPSEARNYLKSYVEAHISSEDTCFCLECSKRSIIIDHKGIHAKCLSS